MPELPEVETMRRGIAPVVGRRILAVEHPRCRKRPILITPGLSDWRRRAVGKRIVETSRIGKRVVLKLDSGDHIVFEPRMTGLVQIADPPSREHLRFCLVLDGSPALRLIYWDRRGLGSVRLFDPCDFRANFSETKVGPDALEITAGDLRARLGKSRRAIKVALLDQRAVAGIGNLYASEILHECSVHPARPCHRLKPHEWTRLHKAVREVLRRAIRYEGSTLSDGTYRNALNQNGSYQNQHRVYDKADQVCGRCGRAHIIRIVQAQRSTFFCPVCQPGRTPPNLGKTFASA